MAVGVNNHTAAARLRLALLALVGAAALFAAWTLLRRGVQVARIVGQWERHDAVLIYDHLPQTIELEVHAQVLEVVPHLKRNSNHAHAEDHVRVLLPRQKYLFSPRLHDLPIAHDPADPSQVRVIAIEHLGLPLSAPRSVGFWIALFSVALPDALARVPDAFVHCKCQFLLNSAMWLRHGLARSGKTSDGGFARRRRGVMATA